MNQKTLKKAVNFSGNGIHTGLAVKMSVSPATIDSGIIFSCQGKRIRATIENVTDGRLATKIGEIIQAEHFLAATNSLGLSNLEVELSEKEFPILDGSCLPFLGELESAGIEEQERELSPIVLKNSIKIEYKDMSIEAFPFDSLEIDFMVDYHIVGRQNFRLFWDYSYFKKEIAPARTFGFLEQIEELRKAGRGRGASLENALVISNQGYANEPRFDNEPVRHKILDLVGDLTLLGRPLLAKIIARKSGHSLHHELVRRILNA